MPKKKGLNQIRAIAARLPVQFYDGFITITGKELMHRTKVKEDSDGKPIDKKKIYKVPSQNRVNHYKRIKKIFNSKGYTAVDDYINEVMQIEAESVVGHSKVMASLPTAPMSI